MASQIAAQMWTLRDFCKTSADLATTAARLRQIGYEAVQVSAMGHLDNNEIRKILDDNGLVACGTHTSIDVLKDNLPALIDELKTLGCAFTAVAYMPKEYRTPDGIKDFSAAMEQGGEALRKEGLSLGYHNHSFEFEKVNGKLMLDWIFEYTTRQNLWAEIDTYWVQHGGANPATWIKRFKNNIPLVHLKDLGIRDEKQLFFAVGEGNLDWNSIIQACTEAKVQWYCVEQDDCNGENPFDCLEKSLKNIKSMGIE